jgi:hypothetical protein
MKIAISVPDDVPAQRLVNITEGDVWFRKTPWPTSLGS